MTAPALLNIERLAVSLAGRAVLHDVSLALSPGEVVALIGPNGCGKTTLLRAALGHVPSIGEIHWQDWSLPDLSRRDLARRAAYLPQTPTFEPGDRVIDTLRLGRSPFRSAFGIESAQDEAVVRSVAADLQLEAMLTRRLDTLSGGQRQRVMLGRCLAQAPVALLLDEPATFLDLRHQVDLYRLLRRLADGRSLGVLMASHDLNLAAVHSDRVIVLKAGRVLAQGATATVLNAELLSEAFGVPMHGAIVNGRQHFFAE